VEVNYNLRTLPTEKLLADWMAEPPPSFKFAIKANQTITLIKRLRNADKAASELIDSMPPLKETGKLGRVLFPLLAKLKCHRALLTDFLAGLSQDMRSVFEFRHDSWFQGSVFTRLRKANVPPCLAESEALETPGVHTADFSNMRMRNEEPAAKGRKLLKQKALKLDQKVEVFVYFRPEETPEGAVHADELLWAIDARCAGANVNLSAQ
jgi:uncharacterized protein YecE (DUF72 family)